MLTAAKFDQTKNDDCKSSSSFLQRKRELLPEEAECPDSPAPSLVSESESSLSSLDNERDQDKKLSQDQKRQKLSSKRVTFDDNEDDPNSKTSYIDVCDKYGRDARSDMWWSGYDLKQIMKREGKFVLDLKISTASNKDVIPLSSSLKHTINDTFKKCVDAPVVLGKDTKSSLVLSWKESAPTPEDRLSSKHETHATTRGLERYVAPILSAHRQMVVQSLLTSQANLSEQDPDTREKVLSERYEHMSKVATNFAIVMGRFDEQLAADL